MIDSALMIVSHGRVPSRLEFKRDNVSRAAWSINCGKTRWRLRRLRQASYYRVLFNGMIFDDVEIKQA